MKIVNTYITLNELKKLSTAGFCDMVKAVVDVKKGIIALGGELHSDLEALLLNEGSKQADLWGINLYPELEGEEFIEFDSMINLRPSQENMSRGVEDEEIRNKIKEITEKKIKR